VVTSLPACTESRQAFSISAASGAPDAARSGSAFGGGSVFGSTSASAVVSMAAVLTAVVCGQDPSMWASSRLCAAAPSTNRIFSRQ
jgi:hypothetical protein